MKLFKKRLQRDIRIKSLENYVYESYEKIQGLETHVAELKKEIEAHEKMQHEYIALDAVAKGRKGEIETLQYQIEKQEEEIESWKKDFDRVTSIHSDLRLQIKALTEKCNKLEKDAESFIDERIAKAIEEYYKEIKKRINIEKGNISKAKFISICKEMQS